MSLVLIQNGGLKGLHPQVQAETAVANPSAIPHRLQVPHAWRLFLYAKPTSSGVELTVAAGVHRSPSPKTTSRRTQNRLLPRHPGGPGPRQRLAVLLAHHGVEPGALSVGR
jgi:hypothetical protein